MQILQIVYAIIIVYVLVLSLRIILGWFVPQTLGRAWEILAKITDPYLDIFRRIRFLRGGVFDFSPIAAVLVLVLAADLIGQLVNWGRITVGFFLASAFAAAWSGARFLLILFLIVGRPARHPAVFPRNGRRGDLACGGPPHPAGRGVGHEGVPSRGQDWIHAIPYPHHWPPVRLVARG